MEASTSNSQDLQLVGPPALRLYNSEAAQIPQTHSGSDSDSEDCPFPAVPKSWTGFTENHSATYLTTGNPCLDFFFQVVPDMDQKEVLDLLRRAWERDSLTALKLIVQLRGVRGSGKGDKNHFYTIACWMHDAHPKTLVANLDIFARIGYFKDLLEVLLRVLQGPKETEEKIEFAAAHRAKRKSRAAKKDASKSLKLNSRSRTIGRYGNRFHKVKLLRSEISYQKMSPAKRIELRLAARKAGLLKSSEERIAQHQEEDKIKSQEAAKLRKEKTLNLAARAMQKLNEDEKYKRLFNGVAAIFAQRLVSDLEALNQGQLRRISLAAKWCPSLDYSYDRNTLICETIARKMFPRKEHSEYADLNEVQYAYRVRDRLRKEVLVPLREVLKLPEVYMSAQKWQQLPYNRVASVAMRRYKEIFDKHDGERFKKFLQDVEDGKKKIASGALLPHIVLQDAITKHDQVAELQWKSMVLDLKAKGTLGSTLAICDVSGSMSGEPMEVCIALGMLAAEICEAPWHGHVITFSAKPTLHHIHGTTLAQKYNSVKNMHWGFNTDLQKVFDLLLSKARAEEIAPLHMIKRLLVFSDMEFDQASSRPWETDYKVICKKYHEAGYTVPHVIFWNLRASHSTPVTKEQDGVALVSGFSKNQLTLFLKDPNEPMNPESVMNLALSGPVFNELVVVD